MGYPAIENATPFAFEPLFIPDEELRLHFVPLVKATFDIGPGGLAPAEKQVPVNLAGELCGLPGESSYKYEPAGFGFVSPDWEPRCRFGGTYDAAWDENRKPLLPKDFDRRFFNAASPGLVAQGYLRGDEQVTIVGASLGKGLSFKLPGLPPPLLTASGADGDLEVPLHLDTVLLDASSPSPPPFRPGNPSSSNALAHQNGDSRQTTLHVISPTSPHRPLNAE